MRQDWRPNTYVRFGVVLLVLTGIVEIAYYVHYPQPAINPDTPTYLQVVDTILTRPSRLVNIWRLPRYPLFVALVFSFTGRGNLEATSIAQALLFALTTLECYLLAVLLFKRAWVAFLIGLLIGPNVILISYIKPIMSEGLALWELVTLALALLWFLRTMRVRALWSVVLCLILLIMTRPEWVYLPVPLFAYLVVVLKHRQGLRSWWRHVLSAPALIYTVALTYMGINGWTNRYFVLTAVVNLNLLGKVLQYNMQDEAPAQDAALSHQLDVAIAHVDRDPYHVLPYVPALGRDDAAPAGAFAQTIILHHPLEFLLKSVPLVFSSFSHDPFADSELEALRGPLGWLKSSIRGSIPGASSCFCSVPRSGLGAWAGGGGESLASSSRWASSSSSPSTASSSPPWAATNPRTICGFISSLIPC